MAISFMLCGVVNVSAAEYVKDVVSEDYASLEKSSFLAPGDFNADGKVSAVDIAQLRVFFLKGTEEPMNSDVNGDGYVDLRDIVRQKKNSVNIPEFISEGAMQLNGNSVYSGEFLSLLGTGATYEISYSYKSETPIKVVINGLGDEIVYESEVALDIVSVTHTFKTPLSITDLSDVELQIIGSGTIEDFSITRVNMDNELVENW